MWKVDKETKLDFSDVLIKPKISKVPLTTRSNINLETTIGKWTGVPLVVTEMTATGTYEMAEALAGTGVITFINKEYTAEEHISRLGQIRDLSCIGLTTGMWPGDVDKLHQVLKIYPDIGFINIHIANVYGNLDAVCDLIGKLKATYDIPVSAGVVACAEAALILEKAGADIIRVGVGSGSACKTRSEVGVGIPQLSAIAEVAEAVTTAKVLCCGGITNSGDVCKAIGAGADLVILGGMIANSKECGNQVKIQGIVYNNFYGLGSARQYEKHGISQKEYRPDEGRNLMVPATVSVHDHLKQITGGLRSVCTYVGAESVDELYNNITFVRVNNQLNTSMAHYESSTT